MGGWTQREREFARAVSAFAFANPFRKQVLREHVQRATEVARSLPRDDASVIVVRDRPELEPVLHSAERLLKDLRTCASSSHWTAAERELYQDLVLVVMYYRFRERFQETIADAVNAIDRGHDSRSIDYYDDFEGQWKEFWELPGVSGRSAYTCAHTFSCLFLIRRAYHQVHAHLWGNSEATESLRADIWQSIFTHDFRRFGLLLYDRMEDVTTLISGPSGTGKELVARAIGLSRYIPFDSRRKRFRESFFDAFHPVNISALAATIVESELFGHAKGAYTDAVADRSGLFEKCKRGHTVFLDEIGELSHGIQVKLLRVVQNREFQRVGETTLRPFGGKLVVATNRDFSRELSAGAFREDLYYRLCSDVVTTPTLAAQLEGSLDSIASLAERIALRQLGQPEAAAEVAEDTRALVRRELGADYDWPGNFRELEQCVRNVIIRRSYKPIHHLSRREEDPTVAAIRAGTCTADELVSCYCKLLYQRLGSYAATARVVGLDQRTVKRHVIGK